MTTTRAETTPSADEQAWELQLLAATTGLPLLEDLEDLEDPCLDLHNSAHPQVRKAAADLAAAARETLTRWDNAHTDVATVEQARQRVVQQMSQITGRTGADLFSS